MRIFSTSKFTSPKKPYLQRLKTNTILSMILKELKPRKALNKAFLKVKPNRSEIESFKANLITLLDRTNDTESEEFHKNLVSDFLKDTYYKQQHFINTKGRNDLVIHNGTHASSSVGVIIETKKPTNKAEMVSSKKLNTKAFQELVLYYLRERISHKNLEVKHLVITNINEWFVFDAVLFDRLFAQNKNLLKQFQDFEEGRLAETKTDFFYKQIAEPYIDSITSEIEFTYFAIQDYQKTLRNADKTDDSSLIALFKLLSPEHLLKLPFTNDSNSLDRKFYSELLHIIGLTEIKDGGKKLIQRNKEEDRLTGSILEDAIIQLDSLDKLNRLEKPGQFGSNPEEQLFHVALELSITWINRILFLKLLEAQLITYHRFDRLTTGKGDKSFAFLNLDKIKNYDDLNSLFFQVLARQADGRNEYVKKSFEKVPYLNSSLFEPTELEQVTLFISNLQDNKTIPIFSQTVLKDQQGKKRTGKIPTLHYFFEFLDAYDFGAEGSEAIQEDNKTLINASVLGLIFEKINGYKDGSIFTPGFITMYMSRETIRRAVVQKFNEAKGWNCKSFEELKEDLQEEIKTGNRKEVRKQANQLINSLKIIDPAVGSGHFLVSVLNELIAIKSELRILIDSNHEPLNNYTVEVVNDELIVTDEDDVLFQYNPKNKESQRVQETLFHEKQTIIENCLFGVDINSNSVKICRLRLWIELLKNAYYKNSTELETLPNIDINIKCGNSLVSRFAIDADLKQALKKSKWTIDSYRMAVATYRNAENKEQKREMERLIADIKSDFRSEISKNDQKLKRKAQLAGELYNLSMQQGLFEESPKQQKERREKIEKLEEAITKLEAEIEEIKANKIFENAFEWRFEFPEVLNEEGDFVGFDVVIGNPPYISHDKIEFRQFLKSNFRCFEAFADLYCYFFEIGISILNNKGNLNFITSNSFLKAEYGKPLRDYFNNNGQFVQLINIEDAQIFEDAIVNTVIANFTKNKFDIRSQIVNQKYDINENFLDFIERNSFYYHFDDFKVNNWNLAKVEQINLGRKISKKGKTLEEIGAKIRLGIATGSNEAFVIDEFTANKLIELDSKNIELIKPLLRGRDINRYHFKQEKYILLTKNGIDVKKEYPAIYDYLDSFGDDFKKRGAKGNHWTNLRACSFFDDFKEPKIIWIELTDTNKFAISDNEIYLLNSAYFLIPPKDLNIKFLNGLLNSKVIKYYLRLIANTSGVGTTRWINIYVKDFPVARDVMIESKINEVVNKVIFLKKQNPSTDTTELESQIDQLVYQLYNLTEEEIAIVEGSST